MIDRGVCPFECCVYGRWTTSVETTVYANEGDTTRVAFVLPAREEITGLTGNVHLDPPGLAIARTDLVLAEQDTAGPMRLADGDTVRVLSSVGEGSYRISRDGRIVEAPAFWNLSQTDAGDSDGELMRESDSRWWAQVERDNGDRGWIDMEAVNGIIWGVDACGGPVPDAKGEG